ncbi:MAG: glucosaminidase domain-containing protein [Saprospiraceae bacterium]|nr:glucosaminidase domain-containing protein [Saprospiraceae bacterium]MDW8483173.1 glucosaminidase domain-containing protein [Saprospiraceae bacterium]
MKKTTLDYMDAARSTFLVEEDEHTDSNLIWKCLVLLALLYLIWTDRIVISFDYRSENPRTLPAAGVIRPAKLTEPPTALSFRQTEAHRVQVTLPDNAKGHTRFAIDPSFARRNGCSPEEVERSLELCKAYVERFAPVAQAEMRRFGIPASISLAQGLLESNAGDSPLARKTNNHFGIKCFSKTCKRGHCVNFTDDSHKDFFVRYDNVWSSYRAHSRLLKDSKRYAALFKLDPTDYRAWAKGLQQLGYATDPLYAQKLIALIENLNLNRYDEEFMP